MTAHGDQGAFQRLERGEIDMAAFLPLFGAQMSDCELGNRAYRVYLQRSGRGASETERALALR